MSSLNDPRDSSRETRLTLPKSWKAESVGELFASNSSFYPMRLTLYFTLLDRHNGLDGYVLRWDGDGNKE